MIKVTRLLGESFDLEEAVERSKAIVLTNGIRELTVYVSDDVAVSVVQMMAETRAASEHMMRKASDPVRAPAPVQAKAAPQTAPVSVEEDPGVISGTEYDDPSTGVESV